MSLRIHLMILVAFVAVFAVPTGVMADLVFVEPGYYTGSRTTALGEVIARDGWRDPTDPTNPGIGFRIDWQLTEPAEGSDLWTYEYWLTDLSGDPLDPGAVSHWIMAISPGLDHNPIVTQGANFEVEGPTTYEPPDNSNPYLPAAIYGIKLNVLGDEGDLGYDATYFTFTSEVPPVWGNFYAKDGSPKGDPEYAAAWNVGLETGEDPKGDFADWVPTIDTGYDPTQPPPIPVPPAALMGIVGVGLVGIMALHRRRRR